MPDPFSENSPLVQAIVNALLDEMRDGTYRIGQRLPPEDKLAAEFGVSRVPIRAALAELDVRGVIARAPRCRPVVARLPGDLRPVPDGGTARCVVFWNALPPPAPVNAALLAGIQSALDPALFRLIVAGGRRGSADTRYHSERAYLLHIAEDALVQGVILWHSGDERNAEALRRLQVAGKRLVVISRPPPGSPPVDFVGVDNLHSAMEVVRHLLQRGHRRIAHLTTGDRTAAAAERLEGYRRAIEEADVPFDPALVLPDRFDKPEFVRELLGRPNRPTALFAVDDATAFQAIAGLQAAGLHVPHDIAVAGFGGVEHWRGSPPFLTTAVEALDRMGEAAADLLKRRLEEQPAEGSERILFDAPLSLHGSTAGFPGGR